MTNTPPPDQPDPSSQPPAGSSWPPAPGPAQVPGPGAPPAGWSPSAVPPSAYPPPGNPYGPPGPGYGTPAGYGPPGTGYNFAPEHPEGTTVLVLGILGLVLCQILGPFAWQKGNKVLAEIDQNPGRYSNRGAVSAGRICGIVATVLLGVSLAFFAFWLVLVIAVGTSSST